MRRNHWLLFTAVAVLGAFLSISRIGSTDEGEARERRAEIKKLQDARAELESHLKELKEEFDAAVDEGADDEAEDVEKEIGEAAAEYREVIQRLAQLGVGRKRQPDRAAIEKKQLEEVRALLEKEQDAIRHKEAILIKKLDELGAKAKTSDAARKEAQALERELLRTRQMAKAIQEKAQSIERERRGKVDDHEHGHHHDEEHPGHHHGKHVDHEHEGPEHEIAHVENRIEHMMQAARHLDEAGMHEQSEHLRKAADELRRELHRHIHGEGRDHEDVAREVLETLQALRKEVGALRKEVHEMRALIGELAE